MSSFLIYYELTREILPPAVEREVSDLEIEAWKEQVRKMRGQPMRNMPLHPSQSYKPNFNKDKSPPWDVYADKSEMVKAKQRLDDKLAATTLLHTSLWESCQRT